MGEVKGESKMKTPFGRALTIVLCFLTVYKCGKISGQLECGKERIEIFPGVSLVRDKEKKEEEN